VLFGRVLPAAPPFRIHSPASNWTTPPSFSRKRAEFRIFWSMPLLWKVGMVVLIVCLVASMAIAVVRLATTPTEILGDRFHTLPAHGHRASR
jgi:hypothetical protein